MSSKTKTTATKEEAKPALVPKLRFPEFRAGPRWPQHELGSIAAILKGKGIAKADLDPNGTQACIRYGELYTRYGETISVAVSRTKVPASELFHSKADDVIIPSSGETKIDIAKASCVLEGGIALGGDLNVIRSKLNGTFLSYYLNGPKRLDIAKVAQGDTVVHLYPHQLEALHIAVPSPAEQQKIAECLSSVDELMAAQARKVDALKTHKKGLMQQLFPREGETQPRLRFPEFQNAGEWGDASMGTLLMSSPDYGVNAAAVPFSEHLPKYLRITDISEDGRYLPEKQVSVDLEATDGNYLDEGDIVLARTGASVGKSYQYRKEDGRLVFAGFLIRVKPHPKKLVSTYLANFLTSGQFWKWVAVTSARSGQPGINSTEYSSLVIPLPPRSPNNNASQRASPASTH